ncbi:MAG: hypothetical protein ACK5F8_12805, partial [Bradyrhizobium sp.]|uniref:hypothetical protein n=1 Tax=Bradyrhizobium sp. TaxID=376 RepID=UPI0039188B63
MAGTSERRIPLPGSNRAVPEGATLVGDVDPDERITVVVYVKRRTPDEFTPGSGILRSEVPAINAVSLAAAWCRLHRILRIVVGAERDRP